GSHPKPPTRDPDRKPPMEEPPTRKGPLGDPSDAPPLRRDPPPKAPSGEPKRIQDPKIRAAIDETAEFGPPSRNASSNF
ncbi:MAG TPA: hypothetical protein VM580_33390, partial [Labilithrix sp.]|nr:hypothetical protein [Labilithrix sp.]